MAGGCWWLVIKEQLMGVVLSLLSKRDKNLRPTTYRPVHGTGQFLCTSPFSSKRMLFNLHKTINNDKLGTVGERQPKKTEIGNESSSSKLFTVEQKPEMSTECKTGVFPISFYGWCVSWSFIGACDFITRDFCSAQVLGQFRLEDSINISVCDPLSEAGPFEFRNLIMVPHTKLNTELYKHKALDLCTQLASDIKTFGSHSHA
ncbi:hypothetical protein VNO77_18722 [Canavalia gladiata]|uniref:Uncharacterized protein n=1 Tax=Canavalia gladiata TaxID=3824 RepID=A0AAN9LQ80_CANGL